MSITRFFACSSLALILIVATSAARAVEPNELEGATHGYPGLYDSNGQKLANGEFQQWVENGRLHVTITYRFPDGKVWEEKSVFRQQPEMLQEKWSWRESKEGKTEREFNLDFVDGTAMTHLNGKDVSVKIDIEPGRTFAGFGFTIALSNLYDRLLKGETIELKAIGFTPKPRVVAVNVFQAGLDRIEMGGRVFRGNHFMIRPDLPFMAKLFIRAPDNHIWLTNPKPATFLRWEGPIVMPSDPIIRVDLISDGRSRPAEAIKTADRE
jgi:hypothetical protein